MKFSARLEMLYPELPFLDRITAARSGGFSHVEFWLWKGKDIDAIGERLSREGMSLGVFQGNTEGRMVDPADRHRYCDGVRESLEVAKRLGSSALFCMTDILRADRTVEPPSGSISPEQKEEAVVAVLSELAPEASRHGITLLVEPLNTIVDHSGYFVEHSRIAWRIAARVDHPSVKVLYDVYHMQVMEGNIIDTLTRNVAAIGYVHVADVPGRHEPGTGELNYRGIADALVSAGYDGIVGFEFMPTVQTDLALSETRAAFGFGANR